jgi:hypothetical protein
MSRHLFLTASLLVVAALPAQSQTHQGSHERRPHGPGHVRPDSAMHAVMHALFHGSWNGTLTSAHGTTSAMELSVARDSVLGVVLKVNTNKGKQASAGDIILDEDKQLRWTQELSGAKCKASAALTVATKTSPEILSGRMSCDGVESRFTLQRTSA